MRPDRMPTGAEVRAAAAEKGLDVDAVLKRRRDRRAELAEKRDMTGEAWPAASGMALAQVETGLASP